MVDSKKGSVYFVLFFLTNIAFGFISYWEYYKRFRGNYSNTSWYVLLILMLITWVVAMIKVNNRKQLRAISIYFAVLLLGYILGYIFTQIDIMYQVLHRIYFLQFPLGMGILSILELFHIWNPGELGGILSTLVLLYFYGAFYLKYNKSLNKPQNIIVLLLTEMFSILVIYFIMSGFAFSNNLFFSVIITLVVIVTWLLTTYYYRQDKNILFRIMSIWSFIFALALLKCLLYIFLLPIIPKLWYGYPSVIRNLFSVFGLLFSGAIRLFENEDVWNWAVTFCAFLIFSYSVFSFIRIRNQREVG